MHFGMGLDNVLSARSNTIREESWHICGGILPMNWLDLKERAIRVDISPIQLGIFPENLFSAKSTRPKNAQFCSDTGISLKKLLLYKCNALRANKEPTELGSLPDRLLSPRFKWVRDGQYIKQFENWYIWNKQLDWWKIGNVLSRKLIQINNLLILVIIYLFIQHFRSVFVWDT